MQCAKQVSLFQAQQYKGAICERYGFKTEERLFSSNMWLADIPYHLGTCSI